MNDIEAVTKALRQNSEAAVYRTLCEKLEALKAAVFTTPPSAATLRLVDEFNEELSKSKLFGGRALRVQPFQMDFCQWDTQRREQKISLLLELFRQ